MNNTKARSEEIHKVTTEMLTWERDIAELPPKTILSVAKLVSERTSCHISTAKRHVAKAVRLARGELIASGWGGKRENAGPPEGNSNAKTWIP